ncbi:MAG: hypothetical protein BWZ05_00544 [Bacteroidetes bacterium ADurb.BinA245]|jgi:hypothetical protein|nr:MAG: hypothetical protein BWZ05_00544 [Bacteroidetes bacterium ADurb.BinA245]HNA92271.1 hypothetical protein [Chitinophagaceae bacterium]HND96642.1 hypothetical protein [Chitinophagaceae bacterium]HNJ26559.1 hypothetical protein [Chitinophagaceae bacterium]HNL60471.1 hypothetical protein [Chitinophagaceae bacterium]
MWLVKFFYWLHLLVVPVLVLGLAGLIAGNEMLFAVLTALGIIIGIFLAEYVRRKIGLIRFFGGQFNDKENEAVSKANLMRLLDF